MGKNIDELAEKQYTATVQKQTGESEETHEESICRRCMHPKALKIQKGVIWSPYALNTGNFRTKKIKKYYCLNCDSTPTDYALILPIMRV